MDSNGIKCVKLYIIPGERSFWRSTKGLKFKAWQDAVSITRTFLSSKEHLNLSGISFRVGLEEKEPVKIKMNLYSQSQVTTCSCHSQIGWNRLELLTRKCRITTHTVRSGRFFLECGIEIILPLKKQCLQKLCKCGKWGAEIDHRKYRQLCRLNSWENRMAA